VALVGTPKKKRKKQKKKNRIVDLCCTRLNRGGKLGHKRVGVRERNGRRSRTQMCKVEDRIPEQNEVCTKEKHAAD
jgi:hypothetical protein